MLYTNNEFYGQQILIRFINYQQSISWINNSINYDSNQKIFQTLDFWFINYYKRWLSAKIANWIEESKIVKIAVPRYPWWVQIINI